MTAQGAIDELPTLQVLDPSGHADSPSPGGEEEASRLLGAITRAAVVDEWACAAALAQEIGAYVEAGPWRSAIVSAASALEAGDWWVTDARGGIGCLARGTDLSRLVHQLFATADAADVGRSLPGSIYDRGHGVVSAGAPLATHLSHAVGLGWAARRAGSDRVALAMFAGSGADGGDFHNGLNFAAVMRAPVVFVARGGDGGYEHAGAIAEQGVAYGVEALVCDAADPLAVHRAVSHAVARARRGEGPTLVEATGADDGSERLRRFLDGAGREGSAMAERARGVAQAELEALVTKARQAPRPAVSTLFDDVFSALPPHLVEQRRELGDR